MSETTKQQNGLMARQCGRELPIEVLKSAAGFYLGTFVHNDDYDSGGPFSRESMEYWPTRELAQEALDTGDWTQKPSP